MEADTETRIARMLADAGTALEGLKTRTESYVRWFCSDLATTQTDFRYRWIESRVKTAASVVRNQRTGGWPVDEIWQRVNDMLGLRIVVVTQSDADTLIERIASDARFPVHGIERQDMDQRDTTGYRAIHLKGRATAGTLEVGTEIQIRTAVQDAWAVVSREDLYGKEAVPEVIRTMARIEALHLTATDAALDQIRQEARQASPPSPQLRPEWKGTLETGGQGSVE